MTPSGCAVTLACGVRLHFPAGALTAPLTICFRLYRPEPHLVQLGPHDALLSQVLELQPHGAAFLQVQPKWTWGHQGWQVPAVTVPGSPQPCPQDVGLWLLFVPPRAQRCRDVVVRSLSNGRWSDLETHLEEETPRVRLLGMPSAPVCPLPLSPR